MSKELTDLQKENELLKKNLVVMENAIKRASNEAASYRRKYYESMAKIALLEKKHGVKQRVTAAQAAARKAARRTAKLAGQRDVMAGLLSDARRVLWAYGDVRMADVIDKYLKENCK